MISGHKGQIINVSVNSLKGHQGHGDAIDMDGDGYSDIENSCSEVDCDDTAFSEDNSCGCTDLENKEPIRDANIQTAVDLWVTDQPAAIATYGHISNWCTSNVTDMDELFTSRFDRQRPHRLRIFNSDISAWDVSSVTTMQRMFYFARRFNSDISAWDVSSVTNMSWMFYSATAFNQDLSGWIVSNVTQCDNFSVDTPAWILDKPNFTNCNP